METITRNLDDFMAFREVALSGSFTKAAEKLRTSKTMLSRQVKSLETVLRAQLFHRTTRRVSLTDAGTALLAYSHRVFDISTEASRKLREFGDGDGGTIKISMPVSFGEAFGPSFLTAARKQLPKIRIELDLANEMRDFFTDGIDFALRASDEHHPDLVARHLGQFRDIVCVAPGAPAARAAKKKGADDPAAIPELDCILHSQEDAWNSWTLTKGERDVKVRANGPVATNQYSVMRELCLAGFGIARLPFYFVKEDLAKGTLVQLFPEWQIATHPLYLVYLKQEYASKRQTIIRDEILAWFRARPEYFV